MECNKEEALRAKLIAEGKLEKKDYAGAKKFALKAQSLYPGLDGVSQMLTTLNVYVSAENKIGGEVDWYGMLGVKPTDDDEMIRKQYRKLALMLHPDKNKSVGADGAFKLISEAWCLLSDKSKRLAYNQRRGSRDFQQKVTTHHGGPSAAPARENGNFSFSTRVTTSVPKAQKNSVKPPHTTTPPPSQRTDTFWTICHQCKMHYEYLKMYLNQTLLCPNCHQAFMASETAPPYNVSKPQNQAPRQRKHSSSDRNSGQNSYDPGRDAPDTKRSPSVQSGSNSSRYTYYHQDPLTRNTNVGSTDPSIAAKAANVVQQAQDKLKRAYTEPDGTAGWEEPAKKRNIEDNRNHYGMNYNTTQGNGSYGNASGSALGSKGYGFVGTVFHWPGGRELAPYELRKLLIETGRKELQTKSSLWITEPAVKGLNKEKGSGKQNQQEIHQSANGKGTDQNGNGSSTTKISNQSEESQANLSEDNTNDESLAAASISVPDPDFYDFDQDRSESSFSENEVWAGYDDDDGMPRFYALINKVISRKPFKLRVSWLNSKTNVEFSSSTDWVGSGFYKTCGEFRVGRYETCKSINSFSQKVSWSKGPRGSVLIYPQKGDIWALYQNWSPKWNQDTPDEVIHKYEMWMVLDDYTDEHGISVAPLDKVVGFKTVFRPNMDPNRIKTIPKEEMFCFSHRVPHHLFTGEEAPDVPKGCLELDPAATPLELLQVTTTEDETDGMAAGGGDAAEAANISDNNRS
ncbi:uncharacterized protein LOC127259615 [Andrographis paniculata]|uniref:uncharacterized protein LOC127259615 n=1 Tax=Andrographis paniculata TaxID=175694 RepID=UPI0021E98EF2|nr:uncharacterized protein LOC127259615 [Andrographis paniculata]XP_051143000.1 uncharacterized protein LOC127259615 [Andrographis paniculata]XP_051143001.1 uncharacterized protein LOC127259615 [Andrographis paniculata]